MSPPTADKIRAYDSAPTGVLLFVEDQMMLYRGNVVRFGSVMADYQREAITALSPAVWRIAHGQATAADGAVWNILKFWLEWTKGAGKDTILADLVIYIELFSRQPLSIQIAATDQGQADELRKAAKTRLHYNPWEAECIEIQNWRILGKESSVIAEILSADTAGSHGARPDVLILNEISHVTKWEFIENLLDNATKVPHCLIIGATNAGYQGTPAWLLREIARTSPLWKFLQYAKPAPQISAPELEETRQRNSESRFLRLFYGQWPTGGGDALDHALIDLAICSDLAPSPRAVPGAAYVAGLDIGHRLDPTGFTVLGKKSGGQRLHLARVQCWAPSAAADVDLPAVEEAVYQAHRDFHLQSVQFDPSQAALMAQRLRNRGVPMTEVPFSLTSCSLMASSLLQVFRERLIDLYDDRLLISDLKKLFLVERSNNTFKLEAVRTPGNHADTAIALALALLGAKKLSLSAGGGWRPIKTPGMARSGEWHGVIGHFPQQFGSGRKVTP